MMPPLKAPNPRGSRNREFVALPHWRQRRLFRNPFLLGTAAIAVLFVVTLDRTDVTRLVFDGASDFGVGICELHLDNGRGILDLDCFRR